MKKMKYLIACILFLIGILAVGEFTYTQIQYNLSDDFKSVQCTIDNKELFINDLEVLCQKNNCIAFINIESSSDNYSSNDVFYYTGTSEEIIREKTGIKFDKLTSVVNGTCTFTFKNINEIFESNWFLKDETFYIEGNSNDIIKVITGLENSISINTITPPDNADRYGVLFEIVWGFIIILLLVLTLYDVMFQKKDVAINLVLGNPISHTVFKNILIDIIIYSAFFGLEFFVLYNFTAVNFQKSFLLAHFGILILLNSLMYLMFYLLNICGVLKGYNEGRDLLIFNYILKFATSIVSVVVITVCILTMSSFGDYVEMNELVKDYKNYYYIKADVVVDDSSIDKINKTVEKYYETSSKLYCELYENYNAIIMGVSNNANIMYANSNAFESLSSEIPELTDEFKDNGIVVLKPEVFSNKDISHLKDYLYTDDNEKQDYATIKYKTAKFFSLNDREGKNFALIMNPIIVYNPNKPVLNDNTYTEFNFVCKINDKLFDEISKKYSDKDIIITRSDVCDNFQHYWKAIRSTIFLLMILLIIAVIVDVIIVFSIISLEYKINAKDICIRKILGHNALWRNIRIFVVISSSIIVSGFAANFALIEFQFASVPTIISICLVSFIVETLLAFTKIRKVEKTNIQKILKGGAL